MSRVAIVIVTYNSASEIGACLDALAGLSESEAEILVVDNASADATLAEVVARGARYIANSTNAGFAAAMNEGVRATSAPLILALNPDTRLVSGLDVMSAQFEKPGTGAVGGLLLGDDGAPQKGFMARNLPTPAALIFEVLGINRLWPDNPVNWHYRCLGMDPLRLAEVGQPAGAFLMFSRAAWERVGGFDESFWPIWFEDVDFCARLKASGFRAYYHPLGMAKHTGAHSIAGLVLENRERYWYRSLLGYAGTHFHSAGYRTTCVAVALGAVFRAVTGFPRNGFRGLAVYGGIFRLALGRACDPRRSRG